MQQYSSTRKRRQLAIRYFTYGVMALAVIVISAICVLWALGYRFDFLHRTVEQGALLQYVSYPSGAALKLDTLDLSFRTPGKSTVSAGKHTVTMDLDGYREWSKTVNVSAGQLRWLNYARLVPSTITTSNLKDFKVISGALPSPDRKWFALYTEPDQPSFSLADIHDPTKPVYTTVTLPATVYALTAGQPQQFELVEWDFGARFLLIKHTNGQTAEYIRLDRTGAVAPVNLTTRFNVPIDDIHFSGTSGNVFYAKSAADVRRLDLGAGTISAPIVSGASQFTLYKTDDLAYVADKDTQRSVGVYLDGRAQAIREFDTTQPVLSDVSDYYYDTYAAVARGTSVEIIKNPQDKTSVAKSYATFTTPVSVQWLRFSNNGRFVVAGNGTQYVTYDLETSETFTVNLPGVQTDLAHPLQWLDDYSLVSSADGNIRLSEFDGGNQQVITDSEPGLPVTLSEDQKFLFSVARTTDGFALQSSKMTVK